jgi:cysteine synthase B
MYKTLQDFVGNTPLVRLVRIPGVDNDRRGNVTWPSWKATTRPVR